MIIDTRRLLEMLPSKRWFGAKARPLRAAETLDQVVLDEGPPALVVALVAVFFEDGGRELYHLPLLVSEDGSPRDALEALGRLSILGPLMAHGATLRGESGSFRFSGPGLDPMSPPGRGGVRTIGVEQSNSSVVLDEAWILKLFRRVEVGPNPELELVRLLTGEGFSGIPAQVGEIRYERGHDEVDLGIAQQFVDDGRDGWEETVGHVLRLYDSAETVAKDRERLELVEERSSEILALIEQLGEVTGSLHVVLSREELEPEISSEPINEQDLKEWAERAHRALDDIAGFHPEALSSLVAGASRVIDQLLTIKGPGAKTRIHGDYHLGQVMLTAKGWLILDFEGEPARSLHERRSKESPLRDVAGMLRSFSYATTAALFERAKPGSEEWARLEPWSDSWEELARNRFLRAYLRASHESDFLPRHKEAQSILLNVLELDKALYELAYERGHRPQWVRIPLRGIRRIIQRGEEP